MRLIRSITSTLNFDATLAQLDDCCCLLGLRPEANVSQVREAVMARLANAERAMNSQPEPTMDPVLRANRLEAEAARMHRLYNARRVVMGYNAQAERIQENLLEKLDDGAQAGRAWSRFLTAQASLAEKLADERRLGCDQVANAMVIHADSDRYDGDLEDLVSVVETEAA